MHFIVIIVGEIFIKSHEIGGNKATVFKWGP
jgi:hypothetical protein